MPIAVESPALELSPEQLSSPPIPSKSYNLIPSSIRAAAQAIEREPFDPKKHLNYEAPRKIYTMRELGLGDVGISPTAICEPFSLFTEEGIRQIRAEVLSEPILDKFHRASSYGTQMIRGHCPTARFVYEAWHHPEMLAIVSQIAGVELIPALDYDTGQVNIAIPTDTAARPSRKDDEEGSPAFDWHFDSFPFVCVTMLSDCTGMVGGETAIRNGFGEIIKVRGPRMGTATVMQGRHIQHSATKASGCPERMSMVTCFRPKSPMAFDSTILFGVRGISDEFTLLSQYTTYRLENLEERVRDEIRQLRKREHSGWTFDADDVKQWLLVQKAYIEQCILEMSGGQKLAPDGK